MTGGWGSTAEDGLDEVTVGAGGPGVPEPDDDGFAAIAADAAERTARGAALQQRIETARTEGSSRDGRVRVTVQGTGRVIAVAFEDDAWRVHGAQELGDVVREAIDDAVRRALQLARDQWAELLPGYGVFDEQLAAYDPPSPGLLPLPAPSMPAPSMPAPSMPAPSMPAPSTPTPSRPVWSGAATPVHDPAGDDDGW